MAEASPVDLFQCHCGRHTLHLAGKGRFEKTSNLWSHFGRAARLSIDSVAPVRCSGQKARRNDTSGTGSIKSRKNARNSGRVSGLMYSSYFFCIDRGALRKAELDTTALGSAIFVIVAGVPSNLVMVMENGSL